MRRSTVVLKSLLAALFLSGVTGAYQGPSAPAPDDPAPGRIELLPGYKHIREQGIDTSVGRIVKGDRTVIRYDIGPLAGLHVDPEHKDRCGYYEEEDLEGQTMRLCVSGNAFTLVFVEAVANFYGQAQDEGELFSLISMLKTFHGPHRVRPRRASGHDTP
jgi:hypothetical protein